MKNALLFTMLLGCAAASFAQPVITHHSNPIAGDVQRLKVVTGVPAPALGTGGANATWDYSTFSGNDQQSTFEACPAHTLCSTFPGSSLILETPDRTTAYITSQQSLSVNGLSAGSVDYIYSNPMEILRYPFTYNDSYEDSFVCDYVSMSNVAFTRAGTIQVEADGYGTLRLPHDTFTNLLRVKTEEIYTDYLFSYASFYYHTISHYWYDSGSRDLIAKHVTYYISGQHSGDVFSYTPNKQDKPTDPSDPTDPTDPTNPSGISNMTNIKQSLNIYPNPATDQLRISFSAQAGTHLLIQLYDITGRPAQPVHNVHTIPGSNDIAMDTDGLTPGMYLLKISTDTEVINRNIEIRK